jgi:hypothetical protein
MSLDNHFLEQIFTSKENIETIHYELLENIFNIYDDDGDDALNEDEFVSFISDILYISVLMNRMLESEYHFTNVKMIANWCSSNFKTNLFRIPLSKIPHDLFIEGIVYALTENRNVPLYREQRIVGISFVPELFHYIHYYNDVAKRRGWPVEMIVVQPPTNVLVNPLTHITFEIGAPICIIHQQHFVEYQEFLTSCKPIKEEVAPEPEPKPEPMNQEQQLLEYQERKRRRYNEERAVIEREEREKEEERQRIIRERHEIEDRANREVYEHQQYLEREQQRREQQNLEQEQQQQQQQIILQMQINQIEQLQEQLRQRTRNSQYNSGIDQFDDNTTLELEHIENTTILRTAEGYDPIEGNVNVVEFIKGDLDDRIAFQCGESYYFASKERIKSMIQLENSENALFYGCACEIDGDWTQIETWALLEPTVIVDTVYYNVQQLGLPVRYVQLNDIKKVLTSRYHFFFVERPSDFRVIPSFASDNVLNHGIGSTSGSHCQDGQADGIYCIKSFDPVVL